MTGQHYPNELFERLLTEIELIDCVRIIPSHRLDAPLSFSKHRDTRFYSASDEFNVVYLAAQFPTAALETVIRDSCIESESGLSTQTRSRPGHGYLPQLSLGSSYGCWICGVMPARCSAFTRIPSMRKTNLPDGRLVGTSTTSTGMWTASSTPRASTGRMSTRFLIVLSGSSA